MPENPQEKQPFDLKEELTKRLKSFNQLAKARWEEARAHIKSALENRKSMEEIKKDLKALLLLSKEKLLRTCRKIRVIDRRYSHAVCYSAGAVVLTAALVWGVSTFTIGVNVYVDGQRVAALPNQESFAEDLEQFDAMVTQDLGETYRSDFDIRYEFGVIAKNSMTGEEELQTELLSRCDDIQMLCALSVDGEVIGANEDEAALQAALDTLLAPYQEEGTKLSFDKDVSIETRLCKVSDYKSVEELQQILNAPVEGQVTYTIQAGDTFSAIAPRYGMNVSQLVNLNGGVDPTGMKPGDTLLVSKEVPLLSVMATRQVEYNEAIAYDVTTVEDATMYKNQKKVITPGQEGVMLVQAEQVTKNNELVEQRVLSSQVVQEPVTEVVKVGTKELPANAPTGSYRLPTSGVYTSYFGYRGGGYHTGLDIANSYGTPIYAADGGTVVTAGWKGGYGYCVIIDHGNGEQTLYGHNSKLLVSVGQKVAKGAQIAKMGSTGNSTGNHCHFEIRINGKQVNPLSYVGR